MSEIFRENSVMLCGKWTNNMWGGLDWKQVHGSPRNWVVCKDSWVAARSLFVKSLAQTIQSEAAGKVMTFGIRWSCSLTESLFCGWTPRSVAGYGWLNPTIYIYIYIYIVLIVKINITRTPTHTFPSCHIDTCRDHTCFCRQKSHAHISTFSPTSEILAGRIATFA